MPIEDHLARIKTDLLILKGILAVLIALLLAIPVRVYRVA